MNRNPRCPTCGKECAPPTRGDDGKQQRAPWAPFCSERCKMADLGRWLKGDYAIPAEPAVVPDLDEN